MHGYDIDTHNRTPIFYFIALISGLLSWYIAYISNELSNFFDLILAPPSGMAIFLAVFVLFDKFLWKAKFFYKIGFVHIPDISGVWNGELYSSIDGMEKSIPVELSIFQTYSKIKIVLETKTSVSVSHMATIKMDNPNIFNVRWEYFAQSNNDNSMVNHYRHYGVTHLVLKGRNGEFKKERQIASYYTEEDRNTSGTFHISFTEGH